MEDPPMSMTSATSKELRADINVTPLIDVLLVLLIIFMVIQPIAVRGLDTLVPQPPKSPEQVNRPRAIIVQVLGDREHGVTYKINQTSLNKLEIQPLLSRLFATRTDKSIFIQGDATLDFSSIAEIIDYSHQAGIDTIGIITPRAMTPTEPR
jgi:biopolymer transport protein TolR